MSELPPFDQDLTLPDDHDKKDESSGFATQLSSPTQFMRPGADETEANAAPSTMFETQLGQSQPKIGYIQRDSVVKKSRSNGRLAFAAIGFIVLALLALSLFLPPISILDRLGEDNRTLSGGNFAPLNASKPQVFKNVTFAVTDDGEADDFELRVSSISAEAYEGNRVSQSNWNCESAALLPSYIHPIGDVYSIQTRGYPPSEVQLRLAINDLEVGEFNSAQVDWYGFDPALSRWRFLPIQYLAEQNVIQTRLRRLPTCLVTTQAEPSIPIIGETIESNQPFPTEIEGSTRLLYPRGLHPISNGGVIGVLSSGVDSQDGYKVIPVLSNAINANVTDVQTVETLLADPTHRNEHVTQVINVVVSNDYDGIAIDYRHLPDSADMRDQFSAFLLDLGRGLTSQGRVLVVMLPWPTQQDGVWQTGAYDWARIGQIADEIVVQTPLDPMVFADNGESDTTLAWISSQVSRQRLFLEINTVNVQTSSDGMVFPIGEPLSRLAYSGQIEIDPSSETYAAGDTITAQLDSSYQQASWDEVTHTIAIRQPENGSSTQWIITPQTLQFRIDVASRHGLGGVIFADLFRGEDASALWLALHHLPDETSTPSPPTPSATLSWTVTDSDGNILSSIASDRLSYTIAEGESMLDITAYLLINSQSIPIAQESIDLSGTAVAAATDETSSPPINDEDAVDTVDDGINDDGAESVTSEGDGEENNGTVDNDDTSDESTEPEDDESTPAVDDSNDGVEPDDDANGDDGNVVETPTDDGTADTVSTPPPTESVTLQLGGQIEQFSDETFAVLSQTHMTWIGWQIVYTIGANPDSVESRILEAHAAGYKILISVTGQPDTLNNPDFNQNFANYVGGLAALGADAVEIWEGPNSSRHWLGGQIDPTLYVALLRDASTVIRSANPDTIIISAALQPSVGVSNGGQSDTLWNDDVYRAGMAEAGAAEYIDCIGVHYIQGTVPPDMTTGDERGDAPIYYLPSLIDRVYTAFDRTLPICFTRFGYLSSDGYGELPINLSWANETTIQNQADWLAEAVTLNHDSGTIYLMMIWNIDYKFSSEGAGYALIRGDDSCPACVTLDALSP